MMTKRVDNFTEAVKVVVTVRVRGTVDRTVNTIVEVTDRMSVLISVKAMLEVRVIKVLVVVVMA
jgi:hypothetical protein